MKNQVAGNKSKSGTSVRSNANPSSAKQKMAAPADADIHHIIRTEAYLRSERRGFAPGAELSDWFEAEQDVKRMLSSGASSQP